MLSVRLRDGKSPDGDTRWVLVLVYSQQNSILEPAVMLCECMFSSVVPRGLSGVSGFLPQSKLVTSHRPHMWVWRVLCFYYVGSVMSWWPVQDLPPRHPRMKAAYHHWVNYHFQGGAWIPPGVTQEPKCVCVLVHTTCWGPNSNVTNKVTFEFGPIFLNLG